MLDPLLHKLPVPLAALPCWITEEAAIIAEEVFMDILVLHLLSSFMVSVYKLIQQ
jgi:hypothetical protein